MKRIALILIVTFAIFAQPVSAQGPFGASRSLQLVEPSVPELQLALRSRIITSEQLGQMYLNRIAAYDKVEPMLNSVIHLNGCVRDRKISISSSPAHPRSSLAFRHRRLV